MFEWISNYEGTSDNDDYSPAMWGENPLNIWFMNGYGGDDSLTGGYNSDEINGGNGNDTLNGLSGNDTVTGGNGDDKLYGDSGEDTLNGGRGDDKIYGGAGADELKSDRGVDFLSGGSGDDVIYLSGYGEKTANGDSGDDTFVPDWDYDTINGGTGIDTVDYSGNALRGVWVNLQLGRGEGDIADGDTYRSIENVIGTSYSDVLIGNGAYNTLTGGKGDDVIRGGFGGDELDGGKGTDTLSYNGSGAGVVIDLSTGSASGGDAQGDTYFNFENVSGSAFNDSLTGDEGDNVLVGGAGDDALSGAGGADILRGGAGSDILTGGVGKDLLYGGGGADKFVFTDLTDSSVSRDNQDVIMDFSERQKDKIDLSALDANAAVAGDQAFHFIGKAQFSGHAGELRFKSTWYETIVYADVDGDKIADFAIHLYNPIKMTDGMFIL